MSQVAITLISIGFLAVGLLILVIGRFSQSDSAGRVLAWIALIVAAIYLASGNSPKLGAPDLGPKPSANNAADPSSGPTTEAASAQARPIADNFSWGIAWLSLVFGCLLAAAADDGSRSRKSHRFGWLLVSIGGIVLAGTTQNLLLTFVAIELSTLPATIMLFWESDSPIGRASAVQSLVTGLVAAGLLLVGILIVGSLAGSTNFAQIRGALTHAPVPQHRAVLDAASSVAGDVACVLILSGLGSRFLVMPFQMATAEIFEGARSWTATLIAVLPRAAALVAMIRILLEAMPSYLATGQTALVAIALLNFVIGSVVAWSQKGLRRLAAFALAVHGGLVLSAVAAAFFEAFHAPQRLVVDPAIPGGAGSALLCFTFDSLAIAGLLAMTSSREAGDEIESLPRILRGDPTAKAAVCVLVLSAAGFPPFAGFWGRLWVLRSILSISVAPEHGFLPHQNVGYVVFATIVSLGLVVLAAAYLRILPRVLIDDEIDSPTPGNSRFIRHFGVCLLVVVTLLGLFPAISVRFAAKATENMRSLAAVVEPEPTKKKHKKPATEGDEDEIEPARPQMRSTKGGKQ